MLAWPAERMAHALAPKTCPRQLRRSRAPKELAGAAVTGTLAAERARACISVAALIPLPDSGIVKSCFGSAVRHVLPQAD